MRMFWEKADKEDSDPMAIFRKRNINKMRLRMNPKNVATQYYKMYQLRNHSFAVLELLELTIQREIIKKSYYASEKVMTLSKYDPKYKSKQ